MAASTLSCKFSEELPKEFISLFRERVREANPNADDFTLDLYIALSPRFSLQINTPFKIGDRVCGIISGSLLEKETKQNYHAYDILPRIDGDYYVSGSDVEVIACSPISTLAYFIRIVGTGTYGFAELFSVGEFGKVVVKRPKHTAHGWHKQLAEREAGNLRAIQSPYVIKLLGVLRDPSDWTVDSLLLEYAANGNLLQFLENEFLSLTREKRQFYAYSILLGVRAAHTAMIAIRDLKSENILIDDKGCVKISDFGFSKKLDNGIRTYTICGTPQFIAPEVLSGEGYGLSCDMWAYGYVLQDLFFGVNRIRNDETPLTEHDIRNRSGSAAHLSRLRTASVCDQEPILADLLANLEEEDVSRRYSACQASQHIFFVEVRDRFLSI